MHGHEGRAPFSLQPPPPRLELSCGPALGLQMALAAPGHRERDGGGASLWPVDVFPAWVPVHSGGLQALEREPQDADHETVLHDLCLASMDICEGSPAPGFGRRVVVKSLLGPFCSWKRQHCRV